MSAHIIPPPPSPKEKSVNANLIYPLIVAAIFAAVGGLVRGEITASRVEDLRLSDQASKESIVKVAVLEARLGSISNDVTEMKTDVKALTQSVRGLADEVRNDKKEN